MAERPAETSPVDLQKKAQSNPVVRFGRDLLAADARVARAHKDKDGKPGSKASERLAASSVMMLLGVGLEKTADLVGGKVGKAIAGKFDVKNFAIPPWAKEAVTDGGVAIAYAFVQKQLGEQLPKLKAQDLLALVVDVGAYGGDKLAENVGKSVANTLRKNKNEAPQHGKTSKKKKAVTEPEGVLYKVTNWLNPVTAGATREGASALADWYRAYRDVASGVPEKSAEKAPEPTAKETTIIFLGNEQQLASALGTVAGEGATS